MKKHFWLALVLLVSLPALAACNQETAPGPPPKPAAATDTPEVAPANTAVPPTATSVPPTEVPPTATDVPPTEVPPTGTPLPDPIVIGGGTADDGCTLVDLNPESWSPLTFEYITGADPLFHIFSNDEDIFHFAIELYTVYGPSWTGQTGTFPPDCNVNGICIYLVPDAVNPYWATDGEVEINELSETGGDIELPIDIRLSGLTFEPVPGSSSTGCYHVDEIEIQVEEE